MPTLATLQAQAEDRDLVRKVRRFVLALAPLSVDMPETLTGPDSLPINLFDAGFTPFGMVTSDGFTFTPEFETDSVTPFGSSAPIRTDVMSATRQVSFTTLQTGQRTITELINGADYSGVRATAGGELVLPVPELPIGREYRLIAVGDDGPVEANWILGYSFGLTKLASVGPATWATEGYLQREVTLDVFTDDEIGVPVREHIGGTAAKLHAAKLGYTTTP